MKRLLNSILLIIAICVFCISGYQLLSYFYTAKKEDSLLESIQEQVSKPNTFTIPTVTIPEAETETDVKEENPNDPNSILNPDRLLRQSNLNTLTNTNPDFIAWIQIIDTKINYPVVQSKSDPDYYLKHNFEKQKSSYGSVYMDAACDLEKSKNLVLYGHHMKNGSMFATLNNYDSVSYYEAHPIIQFDTENGLENYQIIGALKIPGSGLESVEQILPLSTTEQFKEFVSYFEKNRFYDTGISYTEEDQFLTLITCEYTYKNGRFLVFSKKVE